MEQFNYDKIREEARRMKISQAEIAAYLNVSQKTISRYFNGESVPTDENREKILSYINEKKSNRKVSEENQAAHQKADEDSSDEFADFIDPSWFGDAELEFAHEEVRLISEVNDAYDNLSRNDKLFFNAYEKELSNVKGYELDFLDMVRSLNASDKEKVIRLLNGYSVSYDYTKKNPEQLRLIAESLLMMTQKRTGPFPVTADPSEGRDCNNISYLDNANYLKCMSIGLIALDFTRFDWYLLYLLRMCVLNDNEGKHSVNEYYDPLEEYVGDLTLGVFNYVKDLAEKHK